MRPFIRNFALAIACAAIFAGCSGSSGAPVAGIIGAPSPTGTPSATPTATPTSTAGASPSPSSSPAVAPLVVTTQTLTFITTGSGADQTTTVSEANDSGGFSTSTTTCAGIVTISQPSASGVITVEPLGAGTCSFTVSDTNGQSLPVNVTVTLTSGSVK